MTTPGQGIDPPLPHPPTPWLLSVLLAGWGSQGRGSVNHSLPEASAVPRGWRGGHRLPASLCYRSILRSEEIRTRSSTHLLPASPYLLNLHPLRIVSLTVIKNSPETMPAQGHPAQSLAPRTAALGVYSQIHTLAITPTPTFPWDLLGHGSQGCQDQPGWQAETANSGTPDPGIQGPWHGRLSCSLQPLGPPPSAPSPIQSDQVHCQCTSRHPVGMALPVSAYT